MTVQIEDCTQSKIAKLKNEIARLEGLKAPKRATYRQVELRFSRNRRKHHSFRYSGIVALKGGVEVSTRQGSLYATILKVLAEQGQLARHAELFTSFSSSASPKTARKLLEQISVCRDLMEKLVRADSEFQEHCDRRTREYRNKAAQGVSKYQRILRNPKICKRGRWVGDLDEALNILSGGRTVQQVQRGKNVGILRRAKLMFDIITINNQQHAVLYQQKHHAAFKL